MVITPSRAAGIATLAAFVPNAGRRYAETRNFDHGPGDRSNVSLLSPYLRYRLITEAEVVEAVRSEHLATAAEKFMQEVLWRTYWKGWLELRPVIWDRYVNEVAALHAEPGDWRVAYAQALSGSTGIDCFDAWVRELAGHGYLHNHARMWFASIWIFTLGLPWQLGAELFYRQLYDGDPASNTLSWRWVAGLQTAGKTYLATTHNIVRFTEGRFVATGLATTAKALIEPATPLQDLPATTPAPVGSVGLLLSEDDLHPESLPLGATTVAAIMSASVVNDRAIDVQAFTRGALADASARAAVHFGAPSEEIPSLTAPAVREWAQRHKVRTIFTAHTPVGPGRTTLEKLIAELADEGILLVQVRRAWDSAA